MSAAVPDLVLPQKARRLIYLVFAVLGVAQGAVPVGYATAELPIPVWLRVISAVVAFVSTAPLLVALINVPPEEPDVDRGGPARAYPPTDPPPSGAVD